MNPTQSAPMAPPTPCPCGRGLPYGQCCGPLHAGAPAPDAQALMRSRYCAYVLGDTAYVLSSWHPDTRPEDLDLGDTAAKRWLGLDVKRHTPVDADHATV